MFFAPAVIRVELLTFRGLICNLSKQFDIAAPSYAAPTVLEALYRICWRAWWGVGSREIATGRRLYRNERGVYVDGIIVWEVP